MPPIPPLPKNVAFVHHHLALGGSERVSLATAQEWHKMGVRSYFFAYDCHPDKWYCTSCILPEVLLLPSKEDLLSAENVDFLAREIQSKGIEILFFCVPNVYNLDTLRTRARCKLVFWLHNTPFFEAITKVEAAKTRGERSWYNKLLWHCYNKYALAPERLLPKAKERYKSLLQQFDAWIVLCPEYKEELIKQLSLPAEEAEKIHYLYNTQKVVPHPNLNKEKEIVYLGRLSRGDKRLDRLVHIWHRIYQELPEWRLTIYGEGKERVYLTQLICKLNLERIRLGGYVANPCEVYRRASILCLTSSYEGWPLAIAEAQNHGVVPIAFDCSRGMQALIGVDSQYGILIPCFDLEAYASTLVQLCTNQEYYHSLQKKIIDRRLHFAPEVNHPLYLDLFTRLA